MFILPMGLNGIEYSPLSKLPPVSEFGEMSKQFWVSGSPLENKSSSIYVTL